MGVREEINDVKEELNRVKMQNNKTKEFLKIKKANRILLDILVIESIAFIFLLLCEISKC